MTEHGASSAGSSCFSQGRHDLADREFRQELAEDPDNPLAHAFLALCLSRAGRRTRRSARPTRRSGSSPTWRSATTSGAASLCDLDRLKEAEAAAQRGDPARPRRRRLSAACWRASRSAAGAGPRRSPPPSAGWRSTPSTPAALNLRAMALVQLGRKDEAAATLGSALADDPENALTHANQGWALLHQGDHAKALEHFREALRLDPELRMGAGRDRRGAEGPAPDLPA